MLYVFLLVCALLSIGLYILVMLNLVPGAAEERLGSLEPLPADLARWNADVESEAGRSAAEEGLVREVRYYFYETNSRLVRQVRYRNAKTNEVVRAEREQVVKRRRVRTGQRHRTRYY